MENKGIIVTGGSFTSRNTVAGDRATINDGSTNSNAQELMKLFDVLLDKINATQETIPEKKDTLLSIQTLKEEIKKEEPNKITLRSIGKTILENLKYVKDIAPIATSMWHYIGLLVA